MNQKGGGALELYLIRHGQTDWNTTGRWQGSQDLPLNEVGLAQADLLRERFATVPVDAVYSSDLLRAKDTAGIIAAAHGLPVFVRPELREMHFGELEGLTRPEGQERYPGFWAKYQVDSVGTFFPGGESFHQVLERSRAFLAGAQRDFPTGTVLAVSHGGLLRAILCYFLDLDPRRRGRIRWGNTGVTHLLWQGERIDLLGLNDLSHLRCRPQADLALGGEGPRVAGASESTTPT